MINALLSMAAGFVLLLVVFGPLERAFTARPAQKLLRPELRTDLCFFAGQYFPFAGMVGATLMFVDASAPRVLPLVNVHDWTSGQPIWLQLMLAVVLGDLIVYWFHRACHRFDFLWRFHAVHHSSESLDWLAAHREHPLDGLMTQLLLNLPGILLGVKFAVFGPVVVFRGMWAIFIHSNVRLPLGPLRWAFGAPEMHHWHHAKVERTVHNFANLAPYLDYVFGTHHVPEGEERYPLGLTERGPRGYFAQLLAPFGVRFPKLGLLGSRALAWRSGAAGSPRQQS